MADLAIESYLAGFQLDLYDCPAEESAIVIWAIHQLSTFQMKWLSARLGGSPASPVNDDLEVSASQRPSWIDREHSTCKIIHEFSYNDMLVRLFPFLFFLSGSADGVAALLVVRPN